MKYLIRTCAGVLILGFVAWSLPSEAKPKRRGRSAQAKIQKKTQGRPALEYDRFRKKVELMVAEKREEQISGLKRLIDLGPSEKEMPDLKFRMAELYFEKSRAFFFLAQDADDKSTNAKDEGERANFLREKKNYTKESKAWSQQAVALYQEIRERYPKYTRIPEVLFALGQSHWNEGRFKDSITVYADLIRNFRDSPLVSEAWIAFGEYYFNEGNVDKALKSYEKAAENKRSRVYGFALYKQAWCYYNKSDWAKALRKFEATVFYSQLAEDMSGENKIALGREAQKDYVRTYSHIGDPKRAKFVMAHLLAEDTCASKACLELVAQLAGIWFDEGHFEESASLYRQLIELDPNNSRNPFFQGRVVDLVSTTQDRKRVILESRRLVEVYEATKQRVESMAADTDAGKEARENIQEAGVQAEVTIRKLAQVWNRTAMKLRSKEWYADAMTMYSDYLKLFPGSKYAYEMTFQLADLFYKLEKYDEAARYYEATVKADPKGKYLIDAANDNILAIEEHLKDLDIKRPKATDVAQPIDKEKQRLIDACDRYVQFVPPDKADKLIAVKFKAGKIYYDYNHFEEAVKRFDDITTQAPEAEEAEYAANLVADIFNAKKDWQSLYDYTTRYLKLPALTKDRPRLLKDLSEASEYAKFSLAQLLQERVEKEKGDVRLVAQAYEEFFTEFPRSANADKAVFNAAVAWDRAGQKPRADELRLKLLAEYKDSPLGADVSFHIAKSYADRAQYREAAKAYLAFAESYKADPRSRDALYNAAVFYAGTGAVKKAATLRLDYLKKFGKDKGAQKEAADIYYAIARDLDRAGRYREAADRYAEFAKQFSEEPTFWDALAREAELRADKLRQASKAEKIESSLLGTYKWRKRKGREIPPNALRHASMVAFKMVDANFRDYQRVRIVTPSLTNPTPFQRSLDEKARAREKLKNAYTKVVTEFQQAESTIAALYGIARTWDEFAQDLTAVPCPRGVTDEVCGLVKEGIEQKAGPAREAAFAAYQTCVQKSNELNAFTEYSTKCVKALEKLAPDAFPAMVEKRMAFQPRSGLEGLRANGLILELEQHRQSTEIANNGVSADKKEEATR
ncbi:MAG: tetratricopeptide repeat protein [Deltaproteobacteria bacterium]|nr:tetratricopeptide repeat protein [Deltaproteobacteria bacterium]